MHGGVLDHFANLGGIDLCFGPLVRRECMSISGYLDKLISEDPSRLVDDSKLPASIFIGLQSKYALGPGETECLAIATHAGCNVSCDDRLARAMIEHELGKARLTGTIGLLKQLVDTCILTGRQVAEAHAKMIAHGAFLPSWP